jgi:hypothetical protein
MDFLRNNRTVLHLLMGILLTMVYPMQELFSGNQNIYFLWGMSDTLPNAFAADPLLNSPDPYPLFSWLISIFPAQFLAIWTTIIYVILSSIYSFSLFGIAERLADIYNSKSCLFSFIALFLFIHSAPIWGTYFKLISAMDLRWMWDSGIAEQGVLRGYLQSSVFGVFLLLSMYFASRRNFSAAIFSLAPAAMMHANYLFLGGILTLVFLTQSKFEKKSLLASALLLLTVLPYSTYLFNHFINLDDVTKAAIDQAVMAGFSENIHVNPANWHSPKLYLQEVILIIGLAIVWNTKFRNSFLGLLSISIGLSALAYLTNNTTLISLNPWRFSIILIPISSALLLGKIVSSGIWELVRPYFFALMASVCVALVHYRILGNSSAEFVQQWWIVHSVVLLVLTIGTVRLSKHDSFSRFLEPLMVMALLVVGLADAQIERVSRSNSEQFLAISKLGSLPEPNTLYIIPSDWTSFRMNARKSVFVDENLVYGPGLPSLMARLEMLKNVSKTGNYLFLAPPKPNGPSIKLIAPKKQKIEGVISSEELTDNYSLHLLRQ